MASVPQYAATPKIGIAIISTANTNRDGTGTIGTVLTAGASGSRIDKIAIKATGITTAGMIRFFIHNGTTATLLSEEKVSAVASPGASTKAFESLIELAGGFAIPTGYSLRASTHNAESFVITAFGGDF